MTWFMALSFSIFKMGLEEKEEWRGGLTTVSGHFPSKPSRVRLRFLP